MEYVHPGTELRGWYGGSCFVCRKENFGNKKATLKSRVSLDGEVPMWGRG